MADLVIKPDRLAMIYSAGVCSPAD
jgi:hypothetical protein